MKYLKNCIKGYITSLIGLAIICLTSYAAIYGKIDWVWNGLAGCGFGCVLIFTPDSIGSIIQSIVNKKTK